MTSDKTEIYVYEEIITIIQNFYKIKFYLKLTKLFQNAQRVMMILDQS